MNEVNIGEEIQKVSIPDYVFSRLISEFRKLKPEEGMAVLYGTYEDKAVKAEKIWIPPKKYLKSTPTGVKLTEMGRKYHSTVDHFEILSDSSPIAWVHSHPIEAPSDIDKTTQSIAQLFQVPVGIFLNYKKLDSPKEAIKAFRIGKNQNVEYIPVQVMRTKAIAPPQPVKIEHPEFTELRKKTGKFHSSLEAYTSAFEEYLSSLPNALSKVAKASTEGDSHLSQEILHTKEDLHEVIDTTQNALREQLEAVKQKVTRTQSRTLQELENARKKVMRELKDFSQAVSTWKEDLEKNIADHYMTIREKLEGIGNQINEKEKKIAKEFTSLQETIDENREEFLSQQEHLQNYLSEKVDEVNEHLQETLHRTTNLLTKKLEDEQKKIKADLKEGWEEIKKLREEEEERIRTLQDTLKKNQQKTEAKLQELREKTTKLEKKLQKSLENEMQTKKLVKSLKEDLKQAIRDEVTKVWDKLQGSEGEGDL